MKSEIKCIAIYSTEFWEICTDDDCDDDKSHMCVFGDGEAYNGRCYIPIPDYPSVQECDQYDALLHGIKGAEVRTYSGDRT